MDEPTVTDLLQLLGITNLSSLANGASDSGWVTVLKQQVKAALDNEALLYGVRTQNMFAALAVALGGSTFIKQEDNGPPLSDVYSCRPPDFRFVLEDGAKLLIEVKNHHTSKASPLKPFDIRRSDFDAYRRYADLFDDTLLFAIYWSAWNIWTLVDQDTFAIGEKKVGLDFARAMKQNRMSVLGDRTFFIDFPLRMIFRARAETVTNRGNRMSFVTERVDLLSQRRLLTSTVDRRFATFLIFWGDWELVSGDAYSPAGSIEGVEYVFGPMSKPPTPFAGIGSWSGMLSRQFRYLTAESGELERLSAATALTSVKALLPADVTESELGIRLMVQEPADDG